MKLTDNIKNRIQKRKENNKNKKEVNKLIKEYKCKLKTYKKNKDLVSGLALKHEIEILEQEILNAESKVKHNSILINIEKKKQIKKCNNELDDLIIKYKMTEKSINKYDGEGSDFSKAKAKKLRAELKKIKKDIQKVTEKIELAAR